ncbi:hypothetical protein TNCV_2681431 [Trichonephila clavipes]|uniref:Uncharacterized protein n=1 Tax=Trichonephila clavipes TaxID=2585209 RepID=A0A8X6S7Y7_TRICX|nr:hypothetical protein TNCV_2681431 [Trichonephila clavipes]
MGNSHLKKFLFFTLPFMVDISLSVEENSYRAAVFEIAQFQFGDGSSSGEDAINKNLEKNEIFLDPRLHHSFFRDLLVKRFRNINVNVNFALGCSFCKPIDSLNPKNALLAFGNPYGKYAPPNKIGWYHQFNETRCLCKSSGCPSVLEEAMERVKHSFARSPQKLTRVAACKPGMA